MHVENKYSVRNCTNINMKIIVLFSASVLINGCFSISAIFESCNKHGFTCQNSTIYKNKQDITYQCVDDSLNGITIDFWVWNFAPQLDIGTLTITDCHTLRLRFTCPSPNTGQKISILYVHHVKELRIYQDQLVCSPTSIIFENVDYLQSIPRNAFSHVQSLCHSTECTLNKLVFENVKIGTIETNGIELINNQLFRIANVVIKTINVGGIKITNNNDASIYILNSEIDTLETLAMQIHANKLTITESTFKLMSYSSINATLHTFEFSANSALYVFPAAFSIESDNVQIVKNHLQNVKTSAFQKITAKNSYQFVDNFISEADAFSLHPSFSSLSNIDFTSNKFACTCDGYLWLAGKIGFGKTYKDVQPFYKHILDRKNNNTCVFKTCMLPLNAVQQFGVANEICRSSTLDAEMDFCESYDFEYNFSACFLNVAWLNVFFYVLIVFISH